MISTIVTFVTTKVVAIVVTTVIVVVAVTSVIVLGHNVTIAQSTVALASQKKADDERTRVIVRIKAAGDDVIVKLNNEETTCDSQITALTKLSKVSTAATQAAIKKGKTEFHTALAPYVRQIQSDEDESTHLTVVTSETERIYLLRISSISVTAIGEDGKHGVLITACQTIIIEIRQIIIVVVKPAGGEGDD
jgi:hypothetical protein